MPGVSALACTATQLRAVRSHSARNETAGRRRAAARAGKNAITLTATMTAGTRSTRPSGSASVTRTPRLWAIARQIASPTSTPIGRPTIKPPVREHGGLPFHRVSHLWTLEPDRLEHCEVASPASGAGRHRVRDRDQCEEREQDGRCGREPVDLAQPVDLGRDDRTANRVRSFDRSDLAHDRVAVRVRCICADEKSAELIVGRAGRIPAGAREPRTVGNGLRISELREHRLAHDAFDDLLTLRSSGLHGVADSFGEGVHRVRTERNLVRRPWLVPGDDRRSERAFDRHESPTDGRSARELHVLVARNRERGDARES